MLFYLVPVELKKHLTEQPPYPVPNLKQSLKQKRNQNGVWCFIKTEIGLDEKQKKEKADFLKRKNSFS